MAAQSQVSVRLHVLGDDGPSLSGHIEREHVVRLSPTSFDLLACVGKGVLHLAEVCAQDVAEVDASEVVGEHEDVNGPFHVPGDDASRGCVVAYLAHVLYRQPVVVHHGMGHLETIEGVDDIESHIAVPTSVLIHGAKAEEAVADGGAGESFLVQVFLVEEQVGMGEVPQQLICSEKFFRRVPYRLVASQRSTGNLCQVHHLVERFSDGDVPGAVGVLDGGDELCAGHPVDVVLFTECVLVLCEFLA